MSTPSSHVLEFRRVLSSSKAIIVVAGAGLSAKSGIPIFRGAGGMWHDFDPLKVSTPAGWRANPSLVWRWFQCRRDEITKAEPNQGHIALAKLSLPIYRDKIAPGSKFSLVTQNIDGLSTRALEGVAKDCDFSVTQWPIEMHGRIFDVLCTSHSCRQRETNYSSPLCPALEDADKYLIQLNAKSDLSNRAHFDAVKAHLEQNMRGPKPQNTALQAPEIEHLDSMLEDKNAIPLSDLPRCSKCGELARPAVTFFGEVPERIEEIQSLVKEADLCLVVGTSSTVHPAAKFASDVKAHGGKVAVFNIDRSKRDNEADFLFLGPCEQLLPEVLGL